MSPFTLRSPRPLSTLATLLAVVATLALAGCGSDNPAPTGPGGGGGGSTSFEGTFSGSNLSGSLTLTIATTTPGPQPGPARARGSVTASGSLVLAGGGGSASLTGTYDDVNDIISVSGGGWSVAGGLTTDGMEGVIGGPGGVSGVFSVQRVGTGADTVIVIVGTFTSTTGGPGGVFNFAIRGAVIRGNAFETGAGFAIPLDGTFTAGSGAISIVNPSDPPGPALATGTLSTNGAATGTYDDGSGEAGTWAGQKQ